jgi:hypothetical protein
MGRQQSICEVGGQGEPPEPAEEQEGVEVAEAAAAEASGEGRDPEATAGD